jgi:hypothetical protein
MAGSAEWDQILWTIRVGWCFELSKRGDMVDMQSGSEFLLMFFFRHSASVTVPAVRFQHFLPSLFPV